MKETDILTFILISCIFVSMIVNNKEKILMDLLLEKGGRITAKEASLAGIHRMFLKQLAEMPKASKNGTIQPILQVDDDGVFGQCD